MALVRPDPGPADHVARLLAAMPDRGRRTVRRLACEANLTMRDATAVARHLLLTGQLVRPDGGSARGLAAQTVLERPDAAAFASGVID
ncbi:MAG: hypothetical protein AB7R55_13000 [Gemmatimonadales bacterium]